MEQKKIDGEKQQAGGSPAKRAFSLAGLFSKQQPIAEKLAPLVKVNERVREMDDALDAALAAKSYYTAERKEALAKIAGMGHTAEDIAEFALSLGKYQGRKNFANRAGLFLSELCNSCADRAITLHLSHLDTPINYLGFRNRKELTVIGNAGSHFGQENEDGSLSLEGNAGSFAFLRMRGGSAKITGSALDYACEEMENGKASIGGNARHHAGRMMRGGQALFNRDVGDAAFEEMSGGNAIVHGLAGENPGRGRVGGHLTIYRNAWNNGRAQHGQ
ncbi:MAG: hypothetical protein WCT52_01695 [Candidatus Micrarchaeia archaeon]